MRTRCHGGKMIRRRTVSIGPKGYIFRLGFAWGTPMPAYATKREGRSVNSESVSPRIAVVISDMNTSRAICALLEAYGMETRPCADAASLLFLMKDEILDAAVLDTSLPGMGGIAFFEKLVWESRVPRVVLLGEKISVAEAIQCLRLGALGVLEKPILPDAMVEFVRSAVLLTASSRHRDELIAEATRRLSCLSPREREMFNGLVAGRTTQGIARAMGIALQTAKVHRSRVLQKLNIRSVPDLVRLDASAHGVDLTFDQPRVLVNPVSRGQQVPAVKQFDHPGRASRALAYAG